MSAGTERGLARGVRIARLALHARCAGLAFADDRGPCIVNRDDRAAIPSEAGVAKIARAIMTALVARRAALRVDDAAAAAAEPASAFVIEQGLCAYAAVPLCDVAGGVVGALFVLHHAPRRWPDEDIDILVGLAELLRDDLDGPSRVSHELRNAMNAVIGFAELLDNGPLDDKQRRLVSMLRSACDHLVRATTSLLVPAAVEPKAETVAASPPQTHAGERAPTLLVVDDNRENRFLIQAFIGDSGFRCELVDSGHTALERLRAQRFDLVLMDLQMPNLDGLSVTRLIRAEEMMRGGRRTPIVAVTAHAMPEQVEAALRAGCDGHLAKPFRRDELLRVIQAHVAAPPVRTSSADDEERELHPGLVALVPAFLAARRRDVQALIDALARRDHESVADLAHTLKGIGGSYGFRLISECGARLESAVRAGDEQAAQAEVAELDAYLARLAVRHAR